MLNQKTAIITGAAKGIGRATAELFAKNKAAKIYAIDILSEQLMATADYLNEIYDTEVIPVSFDITNSSERTTFFKELRTSKDRIDILVNDAGVALSALIEMTSDRELEQCFDVSAFATIAFIRETIRLMKRNSPIDGSRGSIVNLSSIAGIKGNRGQIAYSGAKAAIAGITKSASKELAPYGIRVNAIAPGIIETDMLHTLTDDIIDEMITHVGLGRIGTAQEAANAILFFASDAMSSYVTGQVLNVDGDYLM